MIIMRIIRIIMIKPIVCMIMISGSVVIVSSL